MAQHQPPDPPNPRHDLTDFAASPHKQKMWLSDLSIHQPVFITMIVAAVLITGGLFYSRMAMDLLPDASLPIVVVRTVYPGADPQEVERSVTKPIEDQVVSLNGVESVRSTSTDSVSGVVVEFSMETDAKRATDDVRDRIGTLRGTLPADIEEPLIEKMDMNAAAIMVIAVADESGERSPEHLRTLVDDVIKPRLERVNGVASLNVTGGRVREIHVELRSDRLKGYGASPMQVVQAIRGENLDVPGGHIADGGGEELVRTQGRVRSLDQLGSLSVPTLRGATVRLRELAGISDGFKEVRSLSRLNGQDAVVGEIRKQSGTNLVQVADGVKREIESLHRQYPEIRIGIASDQSTFTRQSVHDVQISLLLGGILAAMVVFLFFRDLRNTLVTVAGLPVVVFGTFGILHSMGITLNIVTLMALSVSIGMLIDDAIVVRENIFRHMERGEDPKVAAGRGTAEIALAVLAVTSTIVAVFLPIAFVGGMTGRFMREFGITVVVAVLLSLVEAFTLAPMLSAHLFHRLSPRQHERADDSRFLAAFGRLNRGYRSLLAWSLDHRKAVVLAGIAALVASLTPLPLMSKAFLPVVDQGEFRVTVELPAGARLQDTDRATREAEEVLLRQPEVEQLFASIGAAEGPVDKSTLYVKLKSLGQTDAFIERIRPQLASSVAGARVAVEKQATTAMFGSGSSMGSVRGRPIQFSVEGPDLAVIDKVSLELMAKLREVPGVTDVDRSLKEGRPERVISLDRDRATDLGVSTAQVGATVRTLINGEVAGSYRDAEKDYDILVRLDEAGRSDPDRILELPVFTGVGAVLPLSAVADAVASTEHNRIDRQNRQRQILVGGGFVGRDMGPVLAKSLEAVDSISLPEGTTIRLAGDAKYMDEAFGSLTLAMVLSVAFVYMILASQFGSYVHPFTIMLALPFSIVGALVSLLAGRFSLDMLALIGMILLMGLVTKNSILLVEFTNQLKRTGLSTRDAILEAGPIRLRPILMTTLAMIFGMIPVAAGFGAGSELRQPMGVSVIGGLITSTLLTLIVVPVAYSLVDDLSHMARGRIARRKPAIEPR